MKKVLLLILVCSLAGLVQANLALNPMFGDGITPSFANWTGGGTAEVDASGVYGTRANIYGWNWNSILQDTGSVFQANTTYTLTVAKMQGIGVDQGRIQLGDFATGAENVVKTFGATQNWQDVSLVVDTADPLYQGLVGKNIGIRIREERWVWSGHPNIQVRLYVSDVRLEATPNIPEPATMALLGLGALVGLRKKR